MFKYIVLIIFVPLMAFLGLMFLGGAILVIYRDFLRRDDKVSAWLDFQFGGQHTGKPRQFSGPLELLGYLVIAVGTAWFGYLILRYGLVGLIAEVFGYEIL